MDAIHGASPKRKRHINPKHAMLGTILGISWTSWYSFMDHLGFGGPQVKSVADRKEQMPNVIAFKTYLTDDTWTHGAYRGPGHRC